MTVIGALATLGSCSTFVLSDGQTLTMPFSHQIKSAYIRTRRKADHSPERILRQPGKFTSLAALHKRRSTASSPKGWQACVNHVQT